MLAIKIPLKNIEKLRKILMEKEIVDRDYKILTEDNYGYISINKDLKKESEKVFDKEIDFEIVEKNLEKLKKQPKNMTGHLKGKLTKEKIDNLKTSFDIIGDLVILEIPEELLEQKDIIGEASLNFTKRKAIFMKKSGIGGITRTRQLEHIAGKNQSETIHKEHGAKLKLDIKTVYFSPRLATERKRIAEQVQNGEIILDMFAGIGPFPILIAKDHKVNIYATDINEDAIKYMKENIKLNKLKGNIIPILGDIDKIAKDKFIQKNIKFDKIIMNLPGTAKDFLELAISLINKNGIIHYYEFSENYNSPIERIKKIAKTRHKEVEILATRKVKSTSPGQWHIVVDAKII